MSIDVEVVVGCRKTTPAGAKTPVRHDDLRSTRQAAFLSGSVPELASRVPNGRAEPQRCLRQLPWYLIASRGGAVPVKKFAYRHHTGTRPHHSDRVTVHVWKTDTITTHLHSQCLVFAKLPIHPI